MAQAKQLVRGAATVRRRPCGDRNGATTTTNPTPEPMFPRAGIETASEFFESRNWCIVIIILFAHAFGTKKSWARQRATTAGTGSAVPRGRPCMAYPCTDRNCRRHRSCTHPVGTCGPHRKCRTRSAASGRALCGSASTTARGRWPHMDAPRARLESHRARRRLWQNQRRVRFVGKTQPGCDDFSCVLPRFDHKWMMTGAKVTHRGIARPSAPHTSPSARR